MAGQEMLSGYRREPGHRKKRARLSDGFKKLSDRTPLRTKLITAVLALVIVALTVISLTSVYVLRSYLTTEHDDQLGKIYQGLTVSPGSSFGGLNTNTVYPVKGNPNVFAGIQQPGDKLSPASGGMGGNSLGPPGQQSVPNIPNATGWANANSGVFLTVGAQSGTDTWRVIVSPVTLDGVSGTLFVGYDLGNVSAEVQRLTTIDLTVSIAIVVVLAVVAIAVVRTNLRPLNDIEMTAGQIAAGHLDHRVPEGNPRTEIGSLGRSLNVMLSQIETAFHAQGEAEQSAHQSEERMRRFIADAAHELRTPLTTIRGFAAHYRQRGGASGWRSSEPASDGSAVDSREKQSPSFGTVPADPTRADYSSRSVSSVDRLSPEDLDHLMGRIESESTRMGMLVEDLLTLARLDQQRPLVKAPVDLLTLSADAVQDARIVSPGRPIDLVVAPGTAFIVDGDEQRLRQVLANLVNNAITHTPSGTPVRVKIARGTLQAQSADAPLGGRRAVPAVVLDIEDDGPGMSSEQAQRVFERFYRADAARNRASGGTGLGLAIVAGLVAAHGGTVSVRTAPGRGADFQVKLPLAPDALAVDDYDEELAG